jgi:competence protein ComEA
MMRMMMVMMLAVGLSAPAAAAQTHNSRSAPAASQTTATAPVNLNTASAAQLEGLPGIGKAMAERIVEYRQKSGGFKKAEDLMNVRGIGEMKGSDAR